MKWFVLALSLAAISCNHNTITEPSQLIPAGGSLVNGSISDTIEFRVFGSIGPTTALIKFQDSVNGLTILPAESLPYVARVTSRIPSIFLFIEADAVPVVSLSSPVITQSVLQVQIVVNGSVFREAFASGYTTLSATASGTWNH